ncbi:MAG: hypothetical protein VX100_19370 [Pseudomonadota bacterium]|nr:hypothetical protein [Pseudomonadota bacterium]
MFKVIKTTLVVLVLTGASYGVYAACGDATCGFKGKTFSCVVDTPSGPRICDENNRCEVSCP